MGVVGAEAAVDVVAVVDYALDPWTLLFNDFGHFLHRYLLLFKLRLILLLIHGSGGEAVKSGERGRRNQAVLILSISTYSPVWRGISPFNLIQPAFAEREGSDRFGVGNGTTRGVTRSTNQPLSRSPEAPPILHFNP